MQKLGSEPKTALVFEEDGELLGMLSTLLRGAGVNSLLADRAQAALALMSAHSPDLIVVSSKVSELSLSEFLREMRKFHSGSDSMPSILVLADFTDSSHFPSWKTVGRVEILTRPFDRARLVAKVRSLLEDQCQILGGAFSFLGLKIDASSEDVHLDGDRIHLTRSEFKLLQEFVLHPGQVLDRDHLIRKVQGEGVAVIDRAIDTHVFSLRKKLGARGAAIETVRGEGYRFRDLMSERFK